MALSDAQINKKLHFYMRGTVGAFEDYCKTCIMITGGDDASGDTAAIPFKWWPAQRDLAIALCDPEIKKIIVDKPRQMGVTWLILAWKLYRAMFWDGIEERITSVGQEESSKALRRVKFMIEHLPWWCTPNLEISNTTTIKIAKTGSWITALPATINAGRGDTLNDILLDEMAFQVYASEIKKSALPALEKRNGKLIEVSTANGVGNQFHTDFSEAVDGKNGFKWFFFSWQADPNRTKKWYSDMLRENGPEYMHENYPETWQQSFLASGRPYFAQDLLSIDISLENSPILDDFHDGFLDGRIWPKIEFIPAPRGFVRVWKKPDGKKKVIFADVAEGLEWGDFDNAYVLDVETRAIEARIRGKMEVGEYADLLMQVGEWYGSGEGLDRLPGLLAVEANNHGIAVTKHCAEAGYRNLYMEHDMKTGKLTGRVGWMTSPGMMGSRGAMLGKFQTEYRMHRCIIRDRELLMEMTMFAHRGPRGKPQAPPGKNDDAVMSFAGALFVATHEWLEEKPEAPDEVFNTPILMALKQEQERLAKADQLPHGGLIELGG